MKNKTAIAIFAAVALALAIGTGSILAAERRKNRELPAPSSEDMEQV